MIYREALSRAALYHLCHNGLSTLVQWVRYSPDFAVLWIFQFCFSCCILHNCRGEVIWVILYSNWIWHLLLKEVIGLSQYEWTYNQNFLFTCGALHKGRTGNHGPVLLLLPSILPRGTLCLSVPLAGACWLAAWGWVSIKNVRKMLWQPQEEAAVGRPRIWIIFVCFTCIFPELELNVNYFHSSYRFTIWCSEGILFNNWILMTGSHLIYSE